MPLRSTEDPDLVPDHSLPAEAGSGQHAVEPRLGARRIDHNAWEVCVWAPSAGLVHVHVVDPIDREYDLAPAGRGYHTGVVEGLPPGARYCFRLDGRREYPDPASRHQPGGVRGPSALFDPGFAWRSPPRGRLDLDSSVLYELHVGTFTEAGTFAAVIPELARLRDLGITAVELMPVAQFAGGLNWGYDGVFPFAVQDSYGGPLGLLQLVDACHELGIDVVLDVVHNHLGPEGCCLAAYGPYFADDHRTPWGSGLGFDGPHREHVRRLFIEAALYFTRDFRIDGLRLDAIDAIRDRSSCSFLRQLRDAVCPHATLIAEIASDDSRPTEIIERGGLGMDAQWSDDFGHAAIPRRSGLLAGGNGASAKLVEVREVFQHGRLVTVGGEDQRRRAAHTSDGVEQQPGRFVVYLQNHDQVANEHGGNRSALVLTLAQRKLVASLLLLAPHTPLLFMGEEWGSVAPFHYFTSFAAKELGEAVWRGREREMGELLGEVVRIPDPQAEETFRASKLEPERERTAEQQAIAALYRALLRVRRAHPALGAARTPNRKLDVQVSEEDSVLIARQSRAGHELIALFGFGGEPGSVVVPKVHGEWPVLLDTEAIEFGGAGSILPTAYCAGEVGLALPRRPDSCLVLSQSGQSERPSG